MFEINTFRSFTLPHCRGSIMRACLLIVLAAAVQLPGSFEAGATDNPPALNYPWNLQLSNTQDTFNLSTYQGKTLLLSFFFTSCQEACPIQTARLIQAQQKLSPKALSASRFLSISIDPDVDTPERIKAYLNSLPVNHDHWQFGRPEDATALHQLMKSLGIRATPAKHIKHSQTLEHTMKILLIDPSGRIMQRYVGDKFDVQRVANEVQTVVRLNSENHRKL